MSEGLIAAQLHNVSLPKGVSFIEDTTIESPSNIVYSNQSKEYPFIIWSGFAEVLVVNDIYWELSWSLTVPPSSDRGDAVGQIRSTGAIGMSNNTVNAGYNNTAYKRVHSKLPYPLLLTTNFSYSFYFYGTAPRNNSYGEYPGEWIRITLISADIKHFRLHFEE